MSRSDFERCTPFEFSKIVESWSRYRQELRRDAWERDRYFTIRTLNPFLKSQIRDPKDFALFPWEKGYEEKTAPKGSSSVERFKEIAARVREMESA